MSMPAPGLREIDAALGEWVAARSGSRLLGRAAAALNLAEGAGHVCSEPGSDAAFTRKDIATLRTHPWLGCGDGPTPFVMDHRGRLYNWRNWCNETRLAQAWQARAAARSLPLDAAPLARDVQSLFRGTDAAATHWQRAAVGAVVGARVFVLAGAPGTGKTTTVVRMLAMLLRHARACGLDEPVEIALAAPTGKAAQRLAESIRGGCESLGSSLPARSPFAKLLPRLAELPALTLHRLLGYQPWDDAFAYGPQQPLAAGIVVVDEASMVDLAMMRRLFEALHPQATLVLLGDPAQLHAIEAGSVLGDVAGAVAENALPPRLAERLSGLGDFAAARDAAPLAGQVLTLTHTWRADAGLRDALAALRAGDAQWLDGVIERRQASAVSWHDCADAAQLAARVHAWLDAQAESMARVFVAGTSPCDALQALRRAQVLCARRSGPFGVAQVNALMTRALAARFGFAADATWYHGRAVIVTRNDAARGLSNGDVGIALAGAQGLRVWFDGATRDAPRAFAPRSLPEHATAWAISIHRSQGSEYDRVAVLLPADAQDRVLSRELLYTAVSRARHDVQLWSRAEVLRAAVSRPVQRRSGLRERLGGT